MLNKLKIALSQPTKWYLQPYFISFCFALWFLIIPFFIGITLLIYYYIDNYNRNIKYGKLDEINEKINELDKAFATKTKSFEAELKTKEASIQERKNELDKFKIVLEKKLKNYKVSKENSDALVKSLDKVVGRLIKK